MLKLIFLQIQWDFLKFRFCKNSRSVFQVSRPTGYFLQIDFVILIWYSIKFNTHPNFFLQNKTQFLSPPPHSVPKAGVVLLISLVGIYSMNAKFRKNVWGENVCFFLFAFVQGNFFSSFRPKFYFVFTLYLTLCKIFSIMYL